MSNKISSFQAAKFSVPLQFNEEELPCNLYEVNTSWRNQFRRKNGETLFSLLLGK